MFVFSKLKFIHIFLLHKWDSFYLIVCVKLMIVVHLLSKREHVY
jgi:hypothetical protein